MNQREKPPALVIFAKEPKPGRVKTRLARHLTPSAAAGVYQALLRDTAKLIEGAADCDPIIFYRGHPSFIPVLKRTFPQCVFRRQSGGDLGTRMKAACRYALRRNGSVMIIGTDCPDLTARDITRARQYLGRYDCVIGPSLDGGYYLIGLKAFEPALFGGIEWSTDKVLAQTLQRAKRKRLSVKLLPVKDDIDTIESLKRFAGRRGNATITSHTRRHIQSLKLS